MNLVKAFQQVRNMNSLSACITRPHRSTFLRTYPTKLVYPDGSSINIRYPEPRQIIKLPLNIWTLSETERKAKIDARKPRKKISIEDDLEDSYDSNKYLKYMKK